MRAVDQWFNEEMYRADRELPVRGSGMMLISAAWGKTYADRLHKYALASLAAPDNLTALIGSRLVVATDETGYPIVSEALAPWHCLGVDTQIVMIPSDVIKALETKRLQLLGLAQNIGMRMAQRARMPVHMLMPDHIHEPAYMPNLCYLGRSHEVVVQRGLSADLARCADELEQYRATDKTLAIDGRTLATIAWRNLHPQQRICVIQGGSIEQDDLSPVHVMIWGGIEAVHITSCRLNPAWMSAGAVQRYRICRSTLDAISFGEERIYLAGPDDGLTFIELSDGDKRANAQRVSLDSFFRNCWRQAGFDDVMMSYWRQPSKINVHAGPGLAEEVINSQHDAIWRRLCRVGDSIAKETMHDLYSGKIKVQFQ